MGCFLANLFGLLLIGAGSLWGIAVGSWLFGDMGGVLGLIVGALWAFHLAENCALMLKDLENKGSRIQDQAHLSFATEYGKSSLPSRKLPWLSRIWGRKASRRPPPLSPESWSFEEIHGRLKTINATLWKQLRSGVLSSCHVGLYEVQINEGQEGLGWREVNRLTVSALHRFEIASTDEERRISLKEALDRIGQKLLIVHRAALRKADRLNPEEEGVIQKNEAELWRLSRILRFPPPFSRDEEVSSRQ
jgi:hypothetical protein